MSQEHIIQIPEPATSRFLFADTRVAWLWALIRIYVGWEWLSAGWAKFGNPVWTGEKAGVAVSGFLQGALQKTMGPHPDVSAWYAVFIQNIALPHATLFSHLVVYGEIAVGVALILGACTGIAAFFGAFMNLNYLFAGTVSTNPFLLFLQIFLILSWRTAGWIGIDRYLLPALGTLWRPGKALRRK